MKQKSKLDNPAQTDSKPMAHKYSDLTERNFLKNRTIVSDDIAGILEDIADTLEHNPISGNRLSDRLCDKTEG